MENNRQPDALLDKARQDLIADMESRGIGAILWNNATAGFPYIPEATVSISEEGGADKVARIMGMYHYNGTLYLIEEDDHSPIQFDNFWNHDTEAPPTVVTMSEDVASKEFGNPQNEKWFTTRASLEEWTAIADCYFQALNQD